MATERQRWQSILDQAVKDLDEFYLTGKSKPEVNGPVAVKFGEYEDRLIRRIQLAKEMIAQSEGGFEIFSEADT